MTIYFALSIAADRIKIGCCKGDPARRVKAHERRIGTSLILLTTAHGGRRVERWWHERHAESGDRYPLSGRLTEWFRPTSQLWDDIGELLLQELPE